ncbi:MAG: hypothetical protein JNK09_02310 [Prolixibacteraceae bacterium]|nr:hypothetical protein [Prolixibacteraceae bacterium]
MKTVLFVSLFFFSGIICLAQKPELIESKEEVIKHATLELDQAMASPEGSLYKFAQKYNITGEYTLQLTLRNKGQVVSVFVADKKDGNIPSQNSLKDKILDFQFSFKMPKNKDYKFSYTFKF